MLPFCPAHLSRLPHPTALLYCRAGLKNIDWLIDWFSVDSTAAKKLTAHANNNLQAVLQEL